MPNRNYDRGRTLEYRTIKNFEDMGCTAIRSAGSHGLTDVIAWNRRCFWLVQIKSGSARMTPADIERFREMPAPPNAIKQIHQYVKNKGKWELIVKDVRDLHR